MAILLTYLALVGVGETLVVLLGLYLDGFTPLYSVVISMLLFCAVLWAGFPLASRLVGDD
jgi:hypothetical protein